VAKAFAPFKQAVIDAGAQDAVASAVSATVVDRKTVLDAFGVDVRDASGKHLYVDIWNAPDAPSIDPHFVWSEDILKYLLLAQDTGVNLWFGGEKSTGKSETARNFAARTGRSFTRINFHKYTTTEDYVGSVGLENGATVFKRGAFLTAFTSPSAVILLDEISNCDAGELAPLNGFLEPNSAVNFGGQPQRRAQGVMIFAADNTLTNGDTSGRYSGTRQMNSSLADRFSHVVHFDFLPRDLEIEALVRHTGRDQVFYDLTLYRANLRNEFQTVCINSSTTCTVFGTSATSNVPKTIHQGIELGLSGLFDRQWEARGVFLYSDFRFDNNALYGNNRMPGFPPMMLRGETLYRWGADKGARGIPASYAGPTFEWVPTAAPMDNSNSVSNDSYALLGFKAGGPVDQTWSWFLDARNLADKKYAATTNIGAGFGGSPGAAYYPGNGRSAYVGLEGKW
jgi:hypothetical protein